MSTLHPYLHLNGNTEEAFSFYKSVFGGELSIMRYGEAPPGETKPSPGAAKKIMHVSLPIGKETMLMGSDMPEAMPPAVMGTNFSITVSADSEEEARRVFEGLSAGGQVVMPLDKTFWGAYFGMLVDKFQIHWMVSYDRGGQK